MTLLDALNRIPEGYSEGHYKSARYRMEKTVFNGGRSVKFHASDLAGTDFVSMNLYHLTSGPILKPCEMSAEKVTEFLAQVVICPSVNAIGGR